MEIEDLKGLLREMLTHLWKTHLNRVMSSHFAARFAEDIAGRMATLPQMFEAISTAFYAINL